MCVCVCMSGLDLSPHFLAVATLREEEQPLGIKYVHAKVCITIHTHIVYVCVCECVNVVLCECVCVCVYI
jgi:hypothetical protein